MDLNMLGWIFTSLMMIGVLMLVWSLISNDQNRLLIGLTLYVVGAWVMVALNTVWHHWFYAWVIGAASIVAGAWLLRRFFWREEVEHVDQ